MTSTRRRAARLLTALFITTLIPALALAASPAIVQETTGRPVAGPSAVAPPVSAYIIESFDFEDGVGGPDTQGWTTADVWQQSTAYFHFDDFVGLAPDYAPIAGSQSLWCGVRADPATCHFQAAPGYGNAWSQLFESTAFAPTGAVTIDFDVVYDMELNYDFLYFEYLTISGRWEVLATYTDTGNDSPTVVAPADSLDATTKFRFRFESDTIGSDEDGVEPTNGAAIIDNIVLSGGVSNTQDFEGEVLGGGTTLDGTWQAKADANTFGDYAALQDGSTLLQQDPVITNNTNVWSFINGSSDTCPAYGAQTVVPYGRVPGSTNRHDYILNETRSPFIALNADTAGTPIPPSANKLVVSFDVYADMDIAHAVFYTVVLRFKVAGCDENWINRNFAYHNPTANWLRVSPQFDIPPGATDVQVALGVNDLAHSVASDGCHSHAPLFDNVEIKAMQEPIVVTNINDSGAGSLRQAILDANVNPGEDIITFDIPGALSTIEIYSALPAVQNNTLIDATSDPDYAGDPVIAIDGWAGGIINGLHLSGSDIEVRGLSIHDFAAHGVYITGDNNVVRGCWIGESQVFGIVGNGQYGVYIIGQDNQIGGPNAGEGNLITGHPTRGVVVNGPGAINNSIRGNSIRDNGTVGIDLNEDVNTPNDDGDPDSGPNNLQNYPEVLFVNNSVGRVEGTLNSQPNTTFIIDGYATPACAVAGRGEGETYLGHTEVTTNADGDAFFVLDTEVTMITGYIVSVTATDPAGNTSEFSPCFDVVEAYAVTHTGDAGPGSLRWMIDQVNFYGQPAVISMEIPTAPPNIITPVNGYADINVPCVIDGFAQSGTSRNTNPTGQGLNATFGVEIDGSVSFASGLRFLADDSGVRGMCIYNFLVTGVYFESKNAFVEGCFIGTDRTGTVDRGNGLSGVSINPSPSPGGLAATVGGNWPHQRNLISGNDNIGVYVAGSFVRIWANLIGTDINGTSAVPNGTGIQFDPGGTIGFVGGGSLNPHQLNVISGNLGPGIYCNGNSTNISNNYIGVDVNCAQPLPNSFAGILVGSDSNVIGTGGGNTIAHNQGDGIHVASGTYNRIQQNSIYSNGELGIDVATNGVSLNPPASFHGPPQVLDVDVVNDRILMSATTLPLLPVVVSFFASDDCDPSGYGEGQVYLGKLNTTSQLDGSVIFNWFSPVDLVGGEFITCTIELNPLGTSEFSNCFEAINTPSGQDVVVELPDPETGDALAEVTYDEVLSPGNTIVEKLVGGPAVPGVWTLTDSCYIDISTDATVSGDPDSILICINYDDSNLPGPESELRLLHYDDQLIPPAWVDATVSLDTNNDVIYGKTVHLSPFLIALPTQPTGIDLPPTPDRFVLHPNAPNPFNPTTTIRFAVPAPGAHVSLRIYDLRGALVRTLSNGFEPAGERRLVWDGRNDHGQTVATGVYFYRLVSGDVVMTRKMTLLK